MLQSFILLCFYLISITILLIKGKDGIRTTSALRLAGLYLPFDSGELLSLAHVEADANDFTETLLTHIERG